MRASSGAGASKSRQAADCTWMPLMPRNSRDSRVRMSKPSGCSMERNPQSSFFSRKCRAGKQRAEKASAMRPHTITSAAMSAGRSSNSRASVPPSISSGATQRTAPRLASHCSVPP
ncbi:hypothetical protein G6F24_017836 [Rhizopus arrhizus]|nr:hypothetical protein G6F24_017836 [Rhizopus arrhizus]